MCKLKLKLEGEYTSWTVVFCKFRFFWYIFTRGEIHSSSTNTLFTSHKFYEKNTVTCIASMPNVDILVIDLCKTNIRQYLKWNCIIIHTYNHGNSIFSLILVWNVIFCATCKLRCSFRKEITNNAETVGKKHCWYTIEK